MRYTPFYDSGKQIGWQSEDLATVVGMEYLPQDAEVDIPKGPAGSAMAAGTNDPMALLPEGYQIVQPPQAPMSGGSPDEPDPYALLPQGYTIQDVPLAQQLDRKTGTPHNVRAMVGSAPQQDRLAQIRQYFPDAQPYEDDNFVYANPKTGQPTLYNPPGFDSGDIPSIGREIASAVGSGAGAILAAGSAPFTAGAGLAAVPLGAGAGASFGAGVYDIARGLLGGVDTRELPERMRDSAVEFGVNAIGHKLGDMIPGAVRNMLPLGKSRTTGMTPVETGQAFRRVGVTPTAGQLTGSMTLLGLENILAKSPTGSQTMRRVGDRQTGLLETAVNDLATQYGNAGRNRFTGPVIGGGSPSEAGRALKKGADDFVERFEGEAEYFYDELYKSLPRDTPVRADNIVQALTQQGQEFAATPTLAKSLENPKLRGYLDGLKADMQPDGTIPYNVLQSFRSKIGRMMSSPMTVDNIPRGELNEVYGALSRDMEAGARARGPEVYRKFQRANNFYSAGLKRIGAVIDDVVNSDTPERAYRFAMEGSNVRNGGGTRLMQLRRSVPHDAWSVVASSVLRRMGDAVPSQQSAETVFSPNTFLTNWNKMSPEARHALFGGTRYKELPEKLENLIKVMANLKESQWMANPSGTAGQSLFANMITFGGGTGLGEMAGAGFAWGVAGAYGGPYLFARALTSPKFVDWLAKAGTMTPRANNAGNMLTRLYAIAQAEPEVEAFIDAYVRNQQDAPRQPVRPPVRPPATPTPPARTGLLN